MSLIAALVAVCAANLGVWAWAVRYDDAAALAIDPGTVEVTADARAGRKVSPIAAVRERWAAGFGRRHGISPAVAWNSLAAASCGAAVGYVVGDLSSAVVLAVVAGAAPVVWARRAERRRHAMLDAQVPQLLDALAAASSAGLSVPNALRRAMPAVNGPLADDLATAVDRVELGSRWRDELQALADASGSRDLRRAVATISRAEALGSPLESTMVELADEVRAIRASQLAERARRAPVKMLFPLVFLVLPAFLLLTVVPVLLSTIRSIR